MFFGVATIAIKLGGMQVLEGLDGLRAVPDGAAITIGNYDGIHVGHQAIIRRLRTLAG